MKEKSIGKIVNREKIGEELLGVRSMINEFGFEFAEGTSFRKFSEEFPNVTKLISQYLKYLDIDTNNIEKLWKNNEVLDWKEDWPVIIFKGERMGEGKNPNWADAFTYCSRHKIV